MSFLFLFLIILSVKENQGRAIENIHFLNDGLWKIKKIET